MLSATKKTAITQMLHKRSKLRRINVSSILYQARKGREVIVKVENMCLATHRMQ